MTTCLIADARRSGQEHGEGRFSRPGSTPWVKTRGRRSASPASPPTPARLALRAVYADAFRSIRSGCSNKRFGLLHSRQQRRHDCACADERMMRQLAFPASLVP